MEVKFMGHINAASHLYHNPGEWSVIYICNVGQKMPDSVSQYSRQRITLFFDDIDSPLPGYIEPTKDDIQNALRFAVGKDKLLVTCSHGFTRSAALAYLSLCTFQPAEEAIKILDTEKEHHPNKLIIIYGAKLLNDMDILKVYEKWKITPQIGSQKRETVPLSPFKTYLAGVAEGHEFWYEGQKGVVLKVLSGIVRVRINGEEHNFPTTTQVEYEFKPKGKTRVSME